MKALFSGGGQRGLPNVMRGASVALFLAALVALIALLTSDVSRHLRLGALHAQMAAYPLMLVGLSYMCLQLSARRATGDLVKGLLLGLAFVLWGAEQLLPPTRLTTLLDGAVVTIFVVDLSLIIYEHLQRHDTEQP